MTDQSLSPVAQAIRDAYENCDELEAAVAAALRTAVNELLPFMEIKPQENLESHRETMIWGMNHKAQLIRHELLAIANELES
jgi:hypothetical protein